MKVKVQLFATLSQYLPQGSQNRTTTLELPSGSSVAEAFKALGLPPEMPKIILLNGIGAKGEALLKDGDVLSVFPPIAGGLGEEIMYFMDLSKAKERELAPGIRAKLLWGQNIMLSFLEMDARSEVPLHSHPHEQMGIVLQGKFEITIGGETKVLKEGDVYLVPGGVTHGVKVLDGQARALDIFHPPREEYK